MAKLPDSQVIKDLAELLNATGLTEIEIESGGMRIKVARSGGHATTAYVPARRPLKRRWPNRQKRQQQQRPPRRANRPCRRSGHPPRCR